MAEQTAGAAGKKPMAQMTQQSLAAAFAGESQAHIKYAAFAERARREGKANVARLFEAASFAEQVHARSHLRVLGVEGSTAQNLDTAIAGETFEFEEMYPAYLAVAAAQSEAAATRTMKYALDTEVEHARLYTTAKKAVAEGVDLGAEAICVCEVCGYTLIGEAPDRCPLCNAPRKSFKAF